MSTPANDNKVSQTSANSERPDDGPQNTAARRFSISRERLQELRDIPMSDSGPDAVHIILDDGEEWSYVDSEPKEA